jgi:hypothetical protein
VRSSEFLRLDAVAESTIGRMQGALYFPFIDVPESAWWTQTLLYWDRIGTIVPQSYLDEPESLDANTLDLVRSGIVRQVFPDELEPRFGRGFERYLDALPERELRQRRDRFQRGMSTRIHADKRLAMATGFFVAVHLGLARDTPSPNENDRYSHSWYRMEVETAAEFMAAIALGLCQVQARNTGRQRDSEGEVSWVPTTDNAVAMSALMAGLDPSRGFQNGDDARVLRLRVQGEVRATEIRSYLLERLLPVPQDPVSADLVLAFRNRHGDLLPALRRYLEDQIDQALATEDEVLRQRRLDRLVEEAEEQVAQARAYLRETGFSRIALSSLFRIFKFVPGLKDPIENAQDLASSLESNADFVSNPLAYLALARNQFAPMRQSAIDPFTGIPLIEAMEDNFSSR